jgi:hypothetical protein
MKNEVLNSEFVLQMQNAIKHKHEYSSFSEFQISFEFFILEIILDRVVRKIKK